MADAVEPWPIVRRGDIAYPVGGLVSEMLSE
jgi:hypothetical protein